MNRNGGLVLVVLAVLVAVVLAARVPHAATKSGWTVSICGLNGGCISNTLNSLSPTRAAEAKVVYSKEYGYLIWYRYE